MRRFLVVVLERKYFVVESEQDNPAVIAEQFSALHEDGTSLKVVAAGRDGLEIECVELGEPTQILGELDLRGFEEDEGDDDRDNFPWLDD